MKINGKPDGGGSAIITGLSVTSNGTYTAGAGVDGYSPVKVSVPIPSFVTEALSVSENGTYNPGQGVDGFSTVAVSVPIPTFVTETLSVSQNGEYTPGQGVDGFSYVSVSIFIPSYSIGSLTATSNTTYDPASYNVDYFSTVTVDVQPPLQAKSVSENGTVTPDEGYYGLSAVEVSVPAYVPVTEVLSVSQNGEYTPGTGVDGFSQVVVDVPQSVTGFTEKELTEKKVTIVNLNNSASYVANNAFYAVEYYGMKTVTLNNCTNIGMSAFKCTAIASPRGLETVSLPVCSYIADYAFQNNTSLRSVYAPMLQLVGGGVFSSCYYLSQVSFPICTSIYSSAFYDCFLLETVSLPMCNYLENQVFQSCWSLSQVYLPECISVGNNCFTNCSALQSIDLPKCVYIYSQAFTGCGNLQSLDLPVCNYIGNSAFAGTGLSIITLEGSSVCTLGGQSVFRNTPIASGTGSIYVPGSLLTEYKAANYWSIYAGQIFPIDVPPTPATLSFSDGLLYGDVTSIESTFIDDYSLGITKADIYEVSLSNLEEIGASVFYKCSNLSSVSLPVLQRVGTGGLDTTNISFLYLPAFVATTGNFAFANNSNLEYVSIPMAYTFNAQTFKGCTKLPGLYLNEISNFTLGLFSGCSRFTTLYYNTTAVTNMGNSNVFDGTAIRSIFLPTSLINNYKTRNNWSYWSAYMQPMPTSSLSFSYMDTVFGWTTELSADYLDWLGLLPDNVYAVHLPFVSEIHSGQFADHNNLSDVYLPIVHSYPDNAFYNCGVLSLELDVNQLGSSVFKNCESLTTVTIANNNGVIPAGEDIFYGCSALSEIKVPNALVDAYKSAQNWSEYSSIIVPSIETDVQFSNGLLYGPATSVSEADYIALGATKTDILEVSLPECTYVDSNTFSGCTNLSSISLSTDTSLSFGKYAFAGCGLLTLSLNCFELGSTLTTPSAATDIFSNCKSLTTVNLPDCEVIGTRVFFGCSSLQTISLPMVGIIGNGAFNGCNSLESIVLPVVLSIGQNTFMNCTSLSMIWIGTDNFVIDLGNSSAFANTAISAGNGSIYVPMSLVEGYQNANNWSFYADKIVGY